MHKLPSKNVSLSLKWLAILTIPLLSACSEDTGGAAGDNTGPDSETIALLETVVGVYDLQDGWAGSLGDQAFLSIRPPSLDGTAEAILYDYDDADNCIPLRPSFGIVKKDEFSTSDRLFMDDIFQFDQAELSISGSTLLIEFIDLNDTDNDNDTSDLVTVTAERIGLTESDLGPQC